MNTPFQDSLDVVGSLAGVFVALVGIATLVGQPWQYSGGAGVMVLQILGALSAVAIGAGLVYLVHFVEA